MRPNDSRPADTEAKVRPPSESIAQTARTAVTNSFAAIPPPALTAPPGLEAVTRAFTHRLKYLLIFGTSAFILGSTGMDGDPNPVHRNCGNQAVEQI